MKQFNNEAMVHAHFESLYPDDSRFDEIEKILTFIKQGNSCQVISLPGVGRSNLLGLMSYNRNVRIKHLGENQKWFHFVILTLSEIKDKNTPNVLKYIFLSLADSLRDRGLQSEHDKLHAIFKEHASFNDELVLFQGLKEALYFLTIEKELTVTFLFSKFEEFLPFIDSHFFTTLKALRTQSKYRFSCVFSLNRPLEELADPTLYGEYYEFFADKTMYLKIMDSPMLNFRISYLEKVVNKKLDQKTKQEVIFQTGGHGKLTKNAIEILLSNNSDSKELEKLLLSQPEIQRVLLELWNSFNPSEQQYLIQPSIKINELYLQNVGIILDKKITIPLLASFLNNKTIKQSNNEIITYDPNKNDILKGSLSISNLFTSSEFKLLKLFLTNKDRVIEREEIINAVWQDSKSIAGVTDQALDQLIFRLRKKIEDNPNNPTHLQTVKGRGFRFTA